MEKLTLFYVALLQGDLPQNSESWRLCCKSWAVRRVNADNASGLWSWSVSAGIKKLLSVPACTRLHPTGSSWNYDVITVMGLFLNVVNSIWICQYVSRMNHCRYATKKMRQIMSCCEIAGISPAKFGELASAVILGDQGVNDDNGSGLVPWPVRPGIMRLLPVPDMCPHSP